MMNMYTYELVEKVPPFLACKHSQASDAKVQLTSGIYNNVGYLCLHLSSISPQTFHFTHTLISCSRCDNINLSWWSNERSMICPAVGGSAMPKT